MKNLLRLEELAQFLLCLGLLIAMDAAWWVYLLLLLGPDIGMLGYLVNSRVGAISYNVLHHKAVAVLMLVFAIPGMVEVLTLWQLEMGVLRATPPLLAGIILYGHASMDRIFGYGLKFGDNFHHTHLGWIGSRRGTGQ
ncbi:MAG: DUF4260 domain-containing protein [Flavobacteriales bacterium]|nr:hypothetical protein [Flavobacteriales bacterium]MCC6578464.1 DUF4260 domain-containing protein [Flavobacteriales bacterium]NUQ13884.1 DUF4260 domain-containing protein [Flavobacteriales bacterium]